MSKINSCIVTQNYSASTLSSGDVLIAARGSRLRYLIADDAGLDDFDRRIADKSMGELDAIFADYLAPAPRSGLDMAAIAAVTRSLLINFPFTLDHQGLAR